MQLDDYDLTFGSWSNLQNKSKRKPKGKKANCLACGQPRRLPLPITRAREPQGRAAPGPLTRLRRDAAGAARRGWGLQYRPRFLRLVKESGEIRAKPAPRQLHPAARGRARQVRSGGRAQHGNAQLCRARARALPLSLRTVQPPLVLVATQGSADRRGTGAVRGAGAAVQENTRYEALRRFLASRRRSRSGASPAGSAEASSRRRRRPLPGTGWHPVAAAGMAAARGAPSSSGEVIPRVFSHVRTAGRAGIRFTGEPVTFF